MPSKVKLDGNTGRMLLHMASRRGCMTTDARNFPPSKVMLPYRRRGLVVLRRQGTDLTRTNVWHLTDKGWDAIGRTRPADIEPVG